MTYCICDPGSNTGVQYAYWSTGVHMHLSAVIVMLSATSMFGPHSLSSGAHLVP